MTSDNNINAKAKMSNTAIPPAILNQTRDVVEPAIKSAIQSLSPEIALPIKYHFGWIDEKGVPTPERSGGSKGIRPALAMLSARYVGAGQDIAVSGAVAVELVHNFSLLHDDIIDKDFERRHRPTVWRVFGVEDALIAGDALLALAFQVLLESEQANAGVATLELVRATSSMIAGQRADMGIDDDADATKVIEYTVKDCELMEAQKTGALLACSASIGAILAEADAPQIEVLRTYGMELGLAFQAVDDMLGIWGDPKITGKPAGNDIREKKKSLPIVLALEKIRSTDSDLFLQLSSQLAKDDMTDSDVDDIVRTLDALDIRTATQDLANQHLDLALRAIQDTTSLDDLHDASSTDNAITDNDADDGAAGAIQEFVELAHFVANRDF